MSDDATRALSDHVGELERLVAQLSTTIRALQERGTFQAERIQEIEAFVRRLNTPLFVEGDPFSCWIEPNVGEVLGYRAGGRLPRFDATFRGTEERVEKLVSGYVPLLHGREPIVDLGCGRGELLAMLQRADISATGVDIDAEAVDLCRGKGLAAERADALAWLEHQEEGSLGAITAIQVLEHLPTDRIVELLGLARAKLRGGGILIAETVNPHAPVSHKGFWVDPTHVRPLFPEVLLVLCAEAEFGTAYALFPGGLGPILEDRFMHPTYAVVATVSGTA